MRVFNKKLNRLLAIMLASVMGATSLPATQVSADTPSSEYDISNDAASDDISDSKIPDEQDSDNNATEEKQPQQLTVEYTPADDIYVGNKVVPVVKSDRADAAVDNLKYTVVEGKNLIEKDTDFASNGIWTAKDTGTVRIKVTKAEDDKYKSAEAEYTVTIKEYDYSSMNNSLTGTMLQGTQFYVEAPTLSLASDNQAVYVVRKGDEWIEADKYQLMPQQGDNRQTLVIARKDKESGAITDIGSLRLDYKYDTQPPKITLNPKEDDKPAFTKDAVDYYGNVRKVDMNIHDVSLDDGSTQLWVKVDDREEFDVFDVDNAQKLIDAGIEYSEWIVTGADYTTCLGTMGYAAPEQFGGMGQTDARTDIYCLGATMYHLVTGMNPCEPPYEIRPIREIDPTLSGGLERIITKCTQPDPNNRYQSAAELMYDLEHYTEIDDMYRKNLKRKLAVFITTSVLTMLLGTSTVLSYCAAEHKKNENYNSILKEADTYDNYDNGYYTAIVTDPTRTEAYIKLNDKLTDDFVLDRDEAQILNRLMVGIDCKDHNGRVHTYDVMAKLKEKNPKGYEDVCYKIGESFLFYYEINVEKDRYSSAAQWFKEVKENHPEAGIYCEISDCLTLISQYDGAKIQQTEKTYEEYKKLWKQINELYAKSENFDSLDAKIQVWNEIDDIVDTNITSFIAVTDKDKVMDLLQTIKDKTEKLDKSIMREQITGLQDNIDKTIEKAQSVKEENKDDL